ncbi:MAG: hypothetical protein EOP49_22195 [Sphingobacteriales bacterium]|nr:MAG: hypothetical protein EOP49_22195 [Sphingobacteriales bacterium]
MGHFKPTPNPYLFVEGNLQLRGWRAGVGFWLQQVTLKDSKGTITDSTGMPLGTGGIKMKMASPLIVPYLTVGRSFSLSGFSLTPQVRLGYAMGKGDASTELSSLELPDTKGYLIGGSLNLGFPASKSLRLGAMVGFNHIRLKEEKLELARLNSIPIGVTATLSI